jgi:FAD/FMN-containing dehydrogenase
MYSREIEKLLEEMYDARPHWGKVNYANAEYLRKTFGDSYEKFLSVKKKLDPNNIFMNEYLEGRIGG